MNIITGSLAYICACMTHAKVRIDKWLHAVRLCKTRSIAAKACENGKVLIEGSIIKASRLVTKGDKISIKDGPILRSFLVIELADKRMGAKLVPNFMKEVTPEDEIAKLKAYHSYSNTYRPRGSGRPTKKDRRQLDDFTFFSDWEED